MSDFKTWATTLFTEKGYNLNYGMNGGGYTTAPLEDIIDGAVQIFEEDQLEQMKSVMIKLDMANKQLELVMFLRDAVFEFDG